jgi:hypothetical protein
MKKKWIFLDFDGVLNSTNFMILRYILKNDPDKEEWEMISDGLFTIDHRNTLALNFLISKLQEKGFEIEIVVSSTWRKDMNIVMDRLRQHKVLTVGDQELKKTVWDARHRGIQILDFCEENSINIEDIIVIDDDSGDIEQHIPAENFLHTSFEHGLTFTLVREFLGEK